MVIFQTFDLDFFIVKPHFKDNGMQNYLQFRSVHKYLQTPTESDMATGKKSIGFSEENIKPLVTSTNSLNSGINYIDNAKIRAKFDGL